MDAGGVNPISMEQTMSDLTDDRLDEIERIANAATPGEWEFDSVSPGRSGPPSARARSLRDEEDSRRRAAMLWMLRETGASYADISRGFGMSQNRAREICQWYGRVLSKRSESVAGFEPFMERLRSCGAIPSSGGRFDPRRSR